MVSSEKKEQQQAEQVYAEMKTYLKQQSKNDLIKMIFEQVRLYKELQGVAKQLVEENKTLKGSAETQPEAQSEQP